MTERKFAIIGGGIGGLALAINFEKNKIKYVMFEKDKSFEQRHQGYGLTLQQGGKTLRQLGVMEKVSKYCTTSSSHFIFDASGSVVLYWGPSKSMEVKNSWNGSFNAHIPRQHLRRAMLDSIDQSNVIWDAFVIDVLQEFDKIKIVYKSEFGHISEYIVDAVVACDGIHSLTRSKFIHSPLNYLGVFVVLGITDNIPLMDKRVVQVSDGFSRIFMMPFTKDKFMWQLSFPMDLEEAQKLKGNENILHKCIERCKNFCSPIPEVLKNTPVCLITGYPVYDRDPIDRTFDFPKHITFLGDAAHCMSPFKGQGANQAIIDAKSLVDKIIANENLDVAFKSYYKEMIVRTQSKVLSSRISVKELHSSNFVDIEYQLERRGFLDQNLKEKVKKMKFQKIGIWSVESGLLDNFAFQE